MNDYVKKKVIRLPFPESLFDKLEVDSCWDCENYLEEKLGDLWNQRPCGFIIDCTEEIILTMLFIMNMAAMKVIGVMLGI